MIGRGRCCERRPAGLRGHRPVGKTSSTCVSTLAIAVFVWGVVAAGTASTGAGRRRGAARATAREACSARPFAGVPAWGPLVGRRRRRELIGGPRRTARPGIAHFADVLGLPRRVHRHGDPDHRLRHRAALAEADHRARGQLLPRPVLPGLLLHPGHDGPGGRSPGWSTWPCGGAFASPAAGLHPRREPEGGYSPWPAGRRRLAVPRRCCWRSW